jgi:23S rRNA pseudouridine2604 synthase
MELRLNKTISDSGICSRREADRYIETGRVTVNGKVAGLGTKVTSFDKIRVNGHLLQQRNNTVYIAFNKPAGITCTTDPSDPDNIVDFVNFPERIFNIGRLDKPSEGLIFLTNDGNIVNKILRAGNQHEKEYIVTVDKPITPEFEKQMQRGVPILGTVTKPCKLTRETDTRFRIVLTQGLNRQIRRMCEALGYEVQTLKRVRIMNVTLAGLSVGEWRFLTEEEMAEINRMVKDSVGTEEASQQKKQNTSKPKPRFDSAQRPVAEQSRSTKSKSKVSNYKSNTSNQKFEATKSKKQHTGKGGAKKTRR